MATDLPCPCYSRRTWDARRTPLLFSGRDGTSVGYRASRPFFVSARLARRASRAGPWPASKKTCGPGGACRGHGAQLLVAGPAVRVFGQAGWMGSVTAQQENRIIDELTGANPQAEVGAGAGQRAAFFAAMAVAGAPDRVAGARGVGAVDVRRSRTGYAAGSTSSEVTARHWAVTLSADPVARLRDTALVGLMLRLGLGAGEAASLRLEDIDWWAWTLKQWRARPAVRHPSAARRC